VPERDLGVFSVQVTTQVFRYEDDLTTADAPAVTTNRWQLFDEDHDEADDGSGHLCQEKPMPLWTMKCEKCEWEGEHVCRFSALDEQTCKEEVGIENTAEEGMVTPTVPKSVCGGKLVRTEEIETAGRTRYAWQT